MCCADPLAECNAPDTTFHIRNSNSCLFRRCYMIFPSWLGFICCFAFPSCYASHLMSSSASHPHVFQNLHPFGFSRFSSLSVRSPDTLARARGTSEILFYKWHKNVLGMGCRFNGWAIKWTPNATKLGRRSVYTIIRPHDKLQPILRTFLCH